MQKKIFSNTLHRGNSRLRSDEREMHGALKEIYYATSGYAGQLFFIAWGCDESKISLTFSNSPRRDVHSYYLRCQQK